MDAGISNSTEVSGCPENRFLVFTNEYYTPLLCLFGAVGNCLSIYVFFTTSSHRSLTSSYYLSALAASDTGFLLNVFAFWLATVQGMDVITTSVSCPIVMYSGQVMGFLSVWFVVAFTVERFFAVCYPLTRPTVCTVTRARRVITGLTLLALFAFSYVLFIAEVISDPHYQSNDTTIDCGNDKVINSGKEKNEMTEGPGDGLEWDWNVTTMDMPQNYILSDEKLENDNETAMNSNCEEVFYFICSVHKKYHTVSQIANYLDTFFTLILPFFAISFLNFRIGRCVWKLKGQRENIVALSKLSRSACGTSATVTAAASSKSRMGVNLVNNDIGGRIALTDSNKNSSHPRNGLTQAQRRSQRATSRGRSVRGTTNSSVAATPRQTYTSAEVRVTKTLLLVSTVFLVFNLPSHAIRVAIFFKQKLLGDPIGCEWFSAQEWANILFNTNFGVNFLLYCVSGRNFRKSLRNICCPKNDDGKLKRRLMGAKPFLQCPYSRSTRGKRWRQGFGEEKREKGQHFHPENDRGRPEPLSDGCTRNPSIHSTAAFVSKTRESFFPTTVTEVETYA